MTLLGGAAATTTDPSALLAGRDPVAKLAATLIPAITTDRSALLARRDPVAKLAAALIPALVLITTVDPVSSGIVVVATVASLPLWGLSWRSLAATAWPLGLAVLSITVGNALFTTAKGGAVVVDAGPLVLTTESLGVGLVAGLRVLAIALPGVVALTTIDPVDLADSLVRHVRVPARFAYGSLAALRLAPLLTVEWQSLTRARRARGFDAGRNPLRAVPVFAGQVFALLVGAVRRGARLATAMDARGFDTSGPRTFARTARFTTADAVLVGGGIAVTALAVGVAVATGAWDPLF
jgi:energy-coupling factor transport system permease protein